MFNNRSVLYPQHVDCKIDDVFLKKGTQLHTDGWDTSTKDWENMVLHLPNTEGGFGVSFNCVTKDSSDTARDRTCTVRAVVRSGHRTIARAVKKIEIFFLSLFFPLGPPSSGLLPPDQNYLFFLKIK